MKISHKMAKKCLKIQKNRKKSH